MTIQKYTFHDRVLNGYSRGAVVQSQLKKDMARASRLAWHKWRALKETELDASLAKENDKNVPG